MSQMLHRAIRKPEKRDLTGLSDSTTDRLEKNDNFPARIQLPGGQVAWWLDEVLAWLEARPRARGRSTAAATAAKQAKLRQARLAKEAGANAEGEIATAPEGARHRPAGDRRGRTLQPAQPAEG